VATGFLPADSANRQRNIHCRCPQQAPDAHFICSANALAETGDWCYVSCFSLVPWPPATRKYWLLR